MKAQLDLTPFQLKILIKALQETKQGPAGKFLTNKLRQKLEELGDTPVAEGAAVQLTKDDLTRLIREEMGG